VDRARDEPPRVRREAVPAPPVEARRGLDQADRSLLHEVGERQAAPDVPPRDRDDEPEVRVDEPLPRSRVARLGSPREGDLVRRRQERHLAGAAEEERNRVAHVGVVTDGSHRSLLSSRLALSVRGGETGRIRRCAHRPAAKYAPLREPAAGRRVPPGPKRPGSVRG